MQKTTLLLLMILLGFVSGCANLAYYHQAVKGQLSLLTGRTQVAHLLGDENAAEPLRVQLIKTTAILKFATELGLPVGNSYSSYVDLERPFVVWNVFAAAADSTSLLSHCFPIAGCVGYKGFFVEADAREFSHQLQSSGFDVYVGGVAAYSTLGWFDDPLLNTFVFRDDARLAGVIFHELAHKVLYIQGDTVFNESFATAVERHLLQSWLATNHQEGVYRRYLRSEVRREEVIRLILMTRTRLAEVFDSELSAAEKLDKKSILITQLKAEYQALQKSWSAGKEFSTWIEQDLNNAHLAAIGAYQSLVPGFSRMLAKSDNLETFFDQVKALSELAKSERDRLLASPTSSHKPK
ncbi:MAG: putative aminopeptidase [Patiriisocius sp.]|jgi:predicted aminopeptidase